MKKETIENNRILKLTLKFSLLIIKYCDALQDVRKFTVSNQVSRSGTSMGVISFEAQNAESKADFVHKIKIAAKEADESQYWLALFGLASNYPDCKILSQKLLEIQKILNNISRTAKQKSSINYLLSFLLCNNSVHVH